MSPDTVISIQQKLLKLIYANFPMAEALALTADQNLLDSGAIDSLGLLIVVDFVEREFSIKVDDNDVVTENFGTVRDLADFVLRKNPNAT